MPVRFHIDEEKNLVHTVCDGVLTFVDVTNHFTQLGAHPAFDDQRDLLLELRADNMPTTRQVFDMIGPMREAFGNRRFNRVAVVVYSDAWYGYARMFDAASVGFFAEPRVFRDINAATAWLSGASSSQKL